MNNNRTILSTRALSNNLIQSTKQQGFHLDCIPFIATQPLTDQLLAPIIRPLAQQELFALFTSVAAVQATFAQLTERPRWKVFAISGATKTELEKHLKPEAIIAHAIDAKSLAPLMCATPELKKVYFFCGEQHSSVIPETMALQGITLSEIVVYKTISQAKLLNQQYDCYMFYSPAAVISFYKDNKVPPAALSIAIGKATEAALKARGVNTIKTAAFPAPEQMLELIFDYFHQT